MGRLLSGNKDDVEVYRGQVIAFEELYRKIVLEVARKKNLED
jgi:hypothetical protein